MAAIRTNMASKMAASGISNMAAVDTKMAANMADIYVNKMASKMAAKNGDLTFNHSLLLFWAENNEQTWRCHEVHQNVQKCTSNGYEHEKIILNPKLQEILSYPSELHFYSENGAQQGTWQKVSYSATRGRGEVSEKGWAKKYTAMHKWSKNIIGLPGVHYGGFWVDKMVFWGKMWREDGEALNNLGTSKHN